MAAIWEFPTIPLVIVCLVLIGGYFPLPATTSRVLGTNPMGPDDYAADEDSLFTTEDYGVFDETTTAKPISPKVATPNRNPPKRCDYNPCSEIHTSCEKLRASTGCLCPGLTSYRVAPEAPKVHSVSWNGSEVVVRWCAPNSQVVDYMVTVGGRHTQTFDADKRSGGVGVEVDHMAEVCVLADNESGRSEGSCLMYRPRGRGNGVAIKAGLIGGALGLLLLVLLAMLLWRRKRQRK